MKKRIVTIGITIVLIELAVVSIMSEVAFANPGYINVSSPYSGNIYFEGGTVSITWASSDNYVKIELYKGGSYYSTISYNTTNDGSHSWIIPYGYASSSYYQIRVINLGDETEYDYSGTFYIHDRYITVTSPDSTDTLFKGDSFTIQWNSNNAGSYVKIELYKTGSYHSTIISSTYNSGYYLWTLSTSLSSSSYYQIKITSISYSDVSDFSESFYLGERSITVTTPSGGETWYRGATYTIRWNSANAGSYVRIQYKRASYYSTIVTSTTNDGTYEWTIPSSASLSSQYQIKITSISYSSASDVSNYFTIDERYIRIDSPEGYDTWYPNETHIISWSSKNAGNNVDIRLYRNDVYVLTIGSDVDNSGTISWTIPSILSSDSNYQVEIRSKNISEVYDYSNKFSIGKRTISITSPDEDEVWYIGDTYKIEWDSEDAGNTVEIELYKDGSYYLTIDSYVPSYSGSYNWKIPSDLPADSSYQIRIVSSSHSDVYGVSEGNFTIEETILQKITTPLLVAIIIISLLVVAYKVSVKFRKGKASKPDEDVDNQPQYVQSPVQMNQTEISQEEYNNIWEGK